MDLNALISSRSSVINGSGIRRVFDEAARTPGAIKLFIGQPDFPVDGAIKNAAVAAIIDAEGKNLNGYTLTQGNPDLLAAVRKHVAWDIGWTIDDTTTDALVTSGTSGALFLAAMALLNPGDEFIIPDPWFVLYPYLAHLCGAKAVACDTYPDFRMTAERVEKLITPRTKAVLVCSPGNPSGVVLTQREQRDLLELCRRKNVLLISDEIYDEFGFSESMTAGRAADASVPACPSAAREPGSHDATLVIRGFGKTYGVTGWRLGYVVGPKAIVHEMRKLQQYVYVCAPAPLQAGAIAAFGVDMTAHIAEYQRRRDVVMRTLGEVTEVAMPGGAFYAFVKVPERLKMTGEEFYQRAKQDKVFIVPGRTFSSRDTHFRLSFAARPDDLSRGLEILAGIMRG
ncbi:MAG: pyridoxal phosphate-dependent aminotransferase [Phycisphaerales bacterium]|nr:pyridoxal phosphate-dependent aminotransferase [Phycisphaerales bacterium]